MKNAIKPEHPLRDQLLQIMIDNGASDLFVTAGTYPAVKISWEIIRIDEGIPEMKWLDTMQFAQSIIDEKQHDKLVKNRNLDFSFWYSASRFRANVSFQMWNYMIVLRLLNAEVPNIDNLGVTEIYKDVTKIGQGLILVTGPTWSGKTTTLAAMVDYINSNYKKHIITIEDPIEYVYTHKQSVVEQKEVGKDVFNYETALIGAMRQAPQVILFGEMRNKAEVSMALTLAETGHLVLSTMHTRSSAQTISRIIDIFSEWEKEQVRMQLADALVAVFSQRLLKLSDGTWVRMVKEILKNNSAIGNLIRENDIHQIPTVMQMGKREWMTLLEDDIVDLIQMWLITEEEWLKYANSPKLIKDALQ